MEWFVQKIICCNVSALEPRRSYAAEEGSKLRRNTPPNGVS